MRFTQSSRIDGSDIVKVLIASALIGMIIWFTIIIGVVASMSIPEPKKEDVNPVTYNNRSQIKGK